jgi:hypothetical protein
MASGRIAPGAWEDSARNKPRGQTPWCRSSAGRTETTAPPIKGVRTIVLTPLIQPVRALRTPRGAREADRCERDSTFTASAS